MSKRKKLQASGSTRPCDGCEAPTATYLLKYIWPIGKLCPKCVEQDKKARWQPSDCK